MKSKFNISKKNKIIIIISSVFSGIIILVLAILLISTLSKKEDSIDNRIFDDNQYLKIDLDIDWENNQERYTLTPKATPDFPPIYYKIYNSEDYKSDNEKTSQQIWIDIIPKEKFYIDTNNNGTYDEDTKELYYLNIDVENHSVSFSTF